PPVVQVQPQVPNFEHVVAPVSALMPNLKSLIPYPSRRNDERRCEKANDQIEKFYEIFKDLSLVLLIRIEEERLVIETMAYSDKYKKILDGICIYKMKLDGEIKKKEEEAITRIKGEALIEKKDPRAFVIPIRLEGKINLNVLADTGSNINVMPYRVYKELGREEVGVTTIIVKFLILDMPIDRDTPILIGRGFLYTCGSILNIIERITSNFDGICHQTFHAAKTSLDTTESDSDDEGEYAIQRNKFGALIYGPKPAQYLNCNDPMDQSLALQAVLYPFRKVCVWKKVVSFLRSLPGPLQHVDWKPDYTGCFNKKEDSDGQWHAEIKLTDPYGNIYDQGDNKLPVIIAKDLSVEEKTALIKVLKSHKQAITWKLSDINGINPEFCTHKILMEEDFKPAVQHQRRFNLKIHEVIKKEVLKFLDAGLIYPISDSPWVSPVHCVPKKGGFIVVENDENELIPTRLVMGWRVCIDYRKLNEVTRKDHFPLPFMDQMLERLAGNEYYFFLDGFSGYFGKFAYRRMPFGLCNAPGTFQRCSKGVKTPIFV
ncbi:hypothetical protein Tco_1435409, partial [Tanacetum coccineum]